MSFDLRRALEAAAPGDVIVVPPGTWAGHLVITRTVTLRGGPGVVVDGGGAGPLLRVEAPAAEVCVEGLTFRRGVAQAGGGVFFADGRLTLRDCAFEGCAAPGFAGGGVYARGERLLVERCRFEGCEARQGGAVLLDELVEAELRDCLFVKNRAARGAALRVKEGARAVVSGCTFAENSAPGAPHAGVTLELAGTLTRTPSLSVEDSVWAEGVEPPAGPLGFGLARCVAPPAFSATGGDSLYVVPRFAEGSWALEAGSPGTALGLATPGRRTLDGVARGPVVGALAPRP